MPLVNSVERVTEAPEGVESVKSGAFSPVAGVLAMAAGINKLQASASVSKVPQRGNRCRKTRRVSRPFWPERMRAVLGIRWRFVAPLQCEFWQQNAIGYQAPRAFAQAITVWSPSAFSDTYFLSAVPYLRSHWPAVCLCLRPWPILLPPAKRRQTLRSRHPPALPSPSPRN